MEIIAIYGLIDFASKKTKKAQNIAKTTDSQTLAILVAKRPSMKDLSRTSQTTNGLPQMGLFKNELTSGRTNSPSNDLVADDLD